jgi:lipopolysaccharide export system permease protein
VKIYQKSLISELSNSVGGAFTVLFSIVTTIGLVRILNQTAGGRYDTSSVLEVVAFSSLTNLPPLIALALFLGVLLTLMRFWQNNEMVVWFSSGALSLMSWIRPVLRFSFPVLLMVAFSSIVLSPWSRSELTAYMDRFAAKEDVSKLSPGRGASGALYPQSATVGVIGGRGFAFV